MRKLAFFIAYLEVIQHTAPAGIDEILAGLLKCLFYILYLPGIENVCSVSFRVVFTTDVHIDTVRGSFQWVQVHIDLFILEGVLFEGHILFERHILFKRRFLFTGSGSVLY